jgi:hypothetical protein
MTRRRALWILGIATLALLAVLGALDLRMQDAGDAGIVDFEVAWTADRAQEILAAWGDEGRDAARLSLWLDYLYLVAYGLFLWLAVRALRDAALRRGWGRFARIAGGVAVLPLVGAACDAVEDAFLLIVLGGDSSDVAPALAAGFASVKFLCLGVAILCLLGGLIALGVASRRGRGGGEAASSEVSA